VDQQDPTILDADRLELADHVAAAELRPLRMAGCLGFRHSVQGIAFLEMYAITLEQGYHALLT
jgi:hypothetical protein